MHKSIDLFDINNDNNKYIFEQNIQSLNESQHQKLQKNYLSRKGSLEKENSVNINSSKNSICSNESTINRVSTYLKKNLNFCF